MVIYVAADCKSDNRHFIDFINFQGKKIRNNNGS